MTPPGPLSFAPNPGRATADSRCEAPFGNGKNPSGIGKTRTPHADPSRVGRVPLWIPLALLLVLIGLAVRRIQADIRGSGFATVDTDEIFAEFDAPWIDPRWRVELSAKIAERPAFAPDAGRTVQAILEDVAQLSFVEQAASARVRWPDAVEFYVQLRQPIACVQVGQKFLTVDRQGVLLSGTWTAPPYVSSGFLPVIGPNDGSFDDWVAGMRLVERHHLAGLAIAGSMWEHFEPKARESLGRSLIDATAAEHTGPAEPGAKILLEGPRTIWFGRSPRDDSEGGLPNALKWQHLALALGVTDETGRDWSLIDLRWDEPELVFNEPAPAGAEPAASK